MCTCDKVVTIEISWSRPGAGFTWLFEAEVMQLMKEMPVSRR
ncbi:transposase family protein [Anaerobacillus sp. HL2]|nr:transposase family protein [Anaerobacillus sp. HL2]